HIRKTQLQRWRETKSRSLASCTITRLSDCFVTRASDGIVRPCTSPCHARNRRYLIPAVTWGRGGTIPHPATVRQRMPDSWHAASRNLHSGRWQPLILGARQALFEAFSAASTEGNMARYVSAPHSSSARRTIGHTPASRTCAPATFA